MTIKSCTCRNPLGFSEQAKLAKRSLNMKLLREWLVEEIDKKQKSLAGDLHGGNKEIMTMIEGIIWAFELCLEKLDKES